MIAGLVRFLCFQSVVLCGKKPSYFYLTMFITSFYLPQFQMPDSLQNGLLIFINR